MTSRPPPLAVRRVDDGSHHPAGPYPSRCPAALGDMYTGIRGVAAICAALLGGVKSGRGRHIDLALRSTC